MPALASATDPAWAARVLDDLDEVLIDHAHCEKKAASSALSLLFRYPEQGELLGGLSSLAREELAHFEQVLGHLRRRGVGLRHQVPSPYAAGLLRAVRPAEPARLVDTLLCMALIEARSHERLALLGDVLPDPALQAFYGMLAAAEARHQERYVELACSVAAPADVERRLAALARHEAAVLAAVPAMPRLHA